MIHKAFNLNSQFVDELLQRIHQLIESAAPATIFGSLFKEVTLVPTREIISKIIDAAVWTSFSTDEGNTVSVSIIFNRAEDTFDTFMFDKPISFDVRNLVKMGAALENPRADIGIWPNDEGDLAIWGFKSRSTNALSANLCVQALGPGRVLITFGGKSLAALIGNQAVFVDHTHLMSRMIPKLSSPVAEQNDKMLWLMRYMSLLNIARKMRAHGRGGTLLAVPEKVEWHRSIDTPVPYTGGANFLESDYDVVQKPSLVATITDFFGALVKNKKVVEMEDLKRMGDQVEQQCRHIARLTAVDGALVMSFDRYVFCFGAKIIVAENQTSARYITVYKPVEGDVGRELSVADLGGTRHQSAAQFAHEQPGSVAFVVSQDGDVTILTKEPETDELIAIQQAELAVIPEGLGAALWTYSLFKNMDLL